MKSLFSSLIFFAAVGFSWSSSAAEIVASGAPRNAGFDNYDCSTISEDMDVLHAGQVIQGTYREWRQFFKKSSEGYATICITILKPQEKTLSKDEAIEFVDASSRVGELTFEGRKQEKENSQSIPEMPADIVPMPLPRLDPQEALAPVSGSPHIGMRLHPLRDPNVPKAKRVYMDGAKPPPPRVVERSQELERAQVGAVDRRQRVTNTQSFPYNVIGQLVIEFEGNRVYTCTGTLVSAYIVITAGHCIHSRDLGGFPEYISFAPGQYQTSTFGSVFQPFGYKYASYVVTNQRWAQVSGGSTVNYFNVPYDYAAVYFSQPFNFTSTFMPIAYNDTRAGANNAGYPGIVQNLPNNGMWFSSGDETSKSILLYRSYQFREFDLDVSPGNSGGPYWVYDGVSRYLTGVVSYTGGANSGGAWIGGPNQAAISAWAAYTPSTLPGGGSGGGESKNGLRVPLVFTSDNPDASSYLRFGNLDPNSGSVNVIISDAFSGETISHWQSPAIPGAASFQYSIDQIENQASPPINPANYVAYSFNIDSTFQGYFQHVLWNKIGQSLTNVTGCDRGVASDNSILMNVHTSRIGLYPSYVVFHNVDTSSAQPELTLYDANSGVEIGTVVSAPIPPDGSRIFSMDIFEDALEFVPSSAQFHLNIALGGAFQGYVQHFVENEAAGVITNMTDKCDLLP